MAAHTVADQPKVAAPAEQSREFDAVGFWVAAITFVIGAGLVVGARIHGLLQSGEIDGLVA